MSAVITSAGTWSALQNTAPLSQAPGAVTRESIVQHGDGVEQRFPASGIAPKATLEAALDGTPELLQFAGLMAAAYSIPTSAAYARIRDLANAALNTEHVENQRVFSA